MSDRKPQRAMILAAGRGERMRPLTDLIPKPLLVVGGKPLIEYHLERLAALGLREVVVNASWLADRLRDALGDGSRWGLELQLLDEGPVPLDTAGGILNALPQLGTTPFLLVNGDVWSDFDLGSLRLAPGDLASLVMVANPAQHPDGDFVLRDGRMLADGTPRLTYSGMGIYDPALFAGLVPGRSPLAPLLREAMRAGRVAGVAHTGRWSDVGTPERLATLERELLEHR